MAVVDGKYEKQFRLMTPETINLAKCKKSLNLDVL